MLSRASLFFQKLVYGDRIHLTGINLKGGNVWCAHIAVYRIVKACDGYIFGNAVPRLIELNNKFCGYFVAVSDKSGGHYRWQDRRSKFSRSRIVVADYKIYAEMLYYYAQSAIWHNSDTCPEYCWFSQRLLQFLLTRIFLFCSERVFLLLYQFLHYFYFWLLLVFTRFFINTRIFNSSLIVKQSFVSQKLITSLY